MSALIVDLFAGGGGASAGIEAALGRPVDIAINHDAVALAVHKANHSSTRHVEEDIWKAKPRALTKGRRVAILWASPDCTHFSVAKGGKPRSAKKRTLAGAVIRWARATRPTVIFLENIREFQGWGPLTKKGQPDKRKKGTSFRRWVRGLERLGYVVEWRTLDASLYGAPTRRRRLFIIARRDGRLIVWPEVTHGDLKKSADLFSTRLQPLRTAGECIDWSLPCPSIFERKKALKSKTLWRIAQGIKRFVIEAAEPFIVGVGGRAGQSDATGASDPVGTITAKNDRAVVVPHITMLNQSAKTGATRADAPLPTTKSRIVTPHLVEMNAENKPRSVGEPIGVVTSQTNRFNLVAPHLVKVNHGKDDARCESLEEPLTTVTAERRGHALVAPTLVQTGYGEREGQGARTPGLDKPLGTVVASAQKHALVSAFIAKHYGDTGQRPGSAGDEPLATITASDHNALTAAHLQRFNHDDSGVPLSEPMPTITARGQHIAEVRAFLTAYYGSSRGGAPLAEPMRTVTTKDRFGLVTVHGIEYQIVDIGMRMLEPHELLAAQFGRFARAYDLSAARTKTAKVRLIGNSVCPEVAEAIVRANCPAESLKAAA